MWSNSVLTATENEFHLYKFQQGRSATLAYKHLLNVFDEGTDSDKTCRRWLKKFETGDFNLSESQVLGDKSLIKARSFSGNVGDLISA